MFECCSENWTFKGAYIDQRKANARVSCVVSHLVGNARKVNISGMKEIKVLTSLTKTF